MDRQLKEEFTSQAKGIAKFLSVDVVVKIFGVTILEFHFPPKDERE